MLWEPALESSVVKFGPLVGPFHIPETTFQMCSRYSGYLPTLAMWFLQKKILLKEICYKTICIMKRALVYYFLSEKFKSKYDNTNAFMLNTF